MLFYYASVNFGICSIFSLKFAGMSLRETLLKVCVFSLIIIRLSEVTR